MKKLFASIDCKDAVSKRIIRYYKLKDEYFGIEITVDEEEERTIHKFENITKNESEIDKILEVLVKHVEFSFQVEYIIEDLMYENI